MIALVMWMECGHSRRQPSAESQPMAKADPQQSGELVLEGTLEPVPARTIDEVPVRLTVPINSWVKEGQVIGETSSPQTEDECAESRPLHVAEAAAQLEVARLDASHARSELDLAEVTAREANDTYSRASLRYRQQLIPQLAYEAALADRDRAMSGLSASEERYQDATKKIGVLEKVSEDAGERSGKCRYDPAQSERRDQMTVVSVRSPAEGIIVPEKPARGQFGIARDAALFRVYANVSASDAALIRPGEVATVLLDSSPSATFRAQVSDAGDVPPDWPKSGMRVVTLSLQNRIPTDRTAGETVHIILHEM